MAKKNEIKKDLLDQLDRNGVFGKHFLNLIDDYMELWEIKNKLVKDIKKRGVSVPWSNGAINPATGQALQSGFKKNESIAELNKTNQQMLKILSELGLKPGKVAAEGGGGNGTEM